MIAFVIAVGARPAAAQQALVRGDVSGTLGWFNAEKSELSPYNDWYNRSLLGEIGLGWYWTNHWKTEVTAGASTEATVYGSTSIDVGGQPLFVPSIARFATRRLSLTQQYQFGDNQWFHPYLGAGIDVVWERSSRRDEQVYGYDQVTRQSRLVRPPLDYPQQTDVRPLPAAAAGFKTYLTRRAFFRGDLRVTFAGGADEVVVRFGFGVDF